MRRTIFVLAVLALAAGCVPGTGTVKPEPGPAKPPAAREAVPPTAEQVNRAFTQLNEKFRVEYERALNEKGVRTFPTNRAAAFDALNAGLVRLGMIAESRDPDVGILTVAAPAPRPLSTDEWRRTIQSDLPMMAAILCPILGSYCTTIKFEPDDYVIVINATVLATPAGGAEVSLTTRMREIAPRPGTPRRDYPPPTAVRTALDKIWGAFDQALAEQQRGGRKTP
jgi:hypothetical protein